MQEFDPLGIGSYMRSRMREILGNDFLSAEPYEVPRFALNEPPYTFIEESPTAAPSSMFYINPDVEWAFPDVETVMPAKGPAQIGEKARGHRQIPGVGTEILETTNTRPARPPRRLFRVDVTENDDNYFLRADLAGMSKENVKISVVEDQNLVSINVEPPKDEFFGLYKSPLESSVSIKQQQQMKESESMESKEHESIGKEEKENVGSAGNVPSGNVPVGSVGNVPVASTGNVPTVPSQQQQQQQQHQEHQELHKKEVCHLIERCTQSMSRTLKMPSAVDMSRIEAEMRDGLLVVKFAKKEKEVGEAKKHFVEIK